MSRNLLSYSLFERLKLSNVLGPVVQKFGFPPTGREAMQEAIPILTTKLSQNPNDSLLWYVLADYYLNLDDFVNAFSTSQRFYQLQPSEPRSAYSLGTVLRTLLSARHEGNPKIEEANTYLSQVGLVPVDPMKCQAALDALDLTVEQAAERAITLFENVGYADIDQRSREHISWILQSMYDNFPQLRIR